MRWFVLLYGGFAYVLGIRSLIYFVGFASDIPWVKTVDSGPSRGWPEALVVDLALLLVFALPHSLMARNTFKRAYARWIPEATLRSTYVLVAALFLMLLMWQWRPIRTVIWQVDSMAGSCGLVGLAIAGWGLAAISYYSIGHLELFGLRQAYCYFKGGPWEPADLVTTGVYRQLRNPIYLGFAVGMWSTPLMTTGHLLLSAGMSLYLLIGMRYERLDLIARFGERYLEYLRTRS